MAGNAFPAWEKRLSKAARAAARRLHEPGPWRDEKNFLAFSTPAPYVSFTFRPFFFGPAP
jgi:hypothetical protein